MDNDAEAYCIRSSTGLKVKPTMIGGQIDGIAWARPAASDRRRVVIRIHRIRTRPTRAFLDVCKRWMDERIYSNPRYIDVKPSLHARPVRLIYEWKDDALVPDDATRRLLESWEAEEKNSV